MAEGQTDYKRPSWDEYFIEVMEAIACRGTCERGRSGCVITRNNQIISAGYVGSPIGEDHCDEVGHLFQKRYDADGSYSFHCIRTVHAEQNAICQAAKNGTPIDGGTLYCKMTPCPVCAKMIINCGIKRVVALKMYHDRAEAERLFSRAGVALEHIHEEEETYAGKGSKKLELEWRPPPLDEDKKKEGISGNLTIKIKKIKDDAIVPAYAYPSDAGMDLYAAENIEIEAGSRSKVSTGIAVELPEGYASLIWDRSGMSMNKGLKTIGGVIDNGYRGEIFVGFANVSKEAVSISRGEKIAQLLIQKVERADIDISDELSETKRAKGGFGSSDFKKVDPVEDLGLDYLPEDADDELSVNLDDEVDEGDITELNKIEEGEQEDGKSRW